MGIPGQGRLLKASVGLTAEEMEQCSRLGDGNIARGVRIACRTGLDLLGSKLRPVWAIQEAARLLQASVNDLQAIACPTASSGSAWGYSLADLDRARSAGAAVMAMPLGVILLGESDDQMVCLDIEAGHLLIADQAHGAAAFPLDLPGLADIAEAIEGAIAHGRRVHPDQIEGHPAIGAELPLGDDLLQVQALGSPGGTRVALAGGAVVQLSGPLSLMQFAAEVRALVVRAMAQSLAQRQSLEQRLQAPSPAAAQTEVAP